MVNPVWYRFAGFELQPMERRLLEAGTPVAVGPRAFRLLVALVERAGHLVGKGELLAAVWPHVVVEENALQAQISALRKLLGPKAIATVSRGGYRFELTVKLVEPESAVPKHNLPRPVTAFVGRKTEMQAIARLLETTRVLTLTGAGGCGKTRLALQVSPGLLGAFPDGIWLVELAGVVDARLVLLEVARVLDVPERPGQTLTQALCEHFSSKRALVLLDNAEHQLEACAALVEEFIRACPQVHVLVTSRERLDIAGEVTYRVPSLATPSSKRTYAPDELQTIESVRLFVGRAQLTRPGFCVTGENASALASVCRRLDGIPLAIELAAPRLRAMSIEEMDRRLDQSLRLLTSGSRTALPRHRTLRALLDWSYDLLGATERALLQRLSWFAGGWTLDAAERVCSGEGIETHEVLDLLTSLVDKSLVIADEIAGATRYTLLETVRQYARECAHSGDAGPRWQARHFDYCLDIAEQAKVFATTPDHAKWLGVLDAEHDNLRAALAWSATPNADVSQGLRLGTALWRFWAIRGYLGEGGKTLLALLTIAPESLDPAIRLEALTRAAFLLARAGDFETARTLFDSALILAREGGVQRPLATVLMSQSAFYRRQGDYAQARKCDEEVFEMLRSTGDRFELSAALGNLATSLRQTGDPKAALPLHEESLAISRELNNRLEIATDLGSLSRTLWQLGDRTAARKANEEALAICREFGSVTGTATALGRLGGLASEEGNFASALSYLKEGLKVFVAAGDELGIVWLLEEIGYACARAKPLHAACLWGAAERLHEKLGFTPLEETEHIREFRTVARSTATDAGAFDAAWRAGRAQALQTAIDHALATTLMPAACAG